MPSRREKIEQMLLAEPQDKFLRYSLALELHKEGSFDEALAGLRALTQDNPPYIPAYFMAAQQLVPQGQVELAREFLRTGIEEARLQGDHHAAGEMGEFLASLGSH